MQNHDSPEQKNLFQRGSLAGSSERCVRPSFLLGRLRRGGEMIGYPLEEPGSPHFSRPCLTPPFCVACSLMVPGWSFPWILHLPGQATQGPGLLALRMSAYIRGK